MSAYVWTSNVMSHKSIEDGGFYEKLYIGIDLKFPIHMKVVIILVSLVISDQIPLIVDDWTLVDLYSSGAGDGILQLLGVNTVPADALAPKVASASAGMVLDV